MSLVANPHYPRSASATRSGDALRFKVEAAYGRIYLSGPDASLFARRLKGVVMNPRRRSYEVSLTLETLMAIRDAAGMTGQQLAKRCDPSVMRWAKAARKSKPGI